MISVSHLVPAPFTQQVARALDEAGSLDAFYCTLVDEPHKAWQRLAKVASGSVGFDLDKNLKRRAVTEIDRKKVISYPYREAFRMLLGKFRKDPVLEDSIFHWALHGFDQWVAKQLKGQGTIYGFEYGSLATFGAAKRHGMRTIYDVPSPEHDFVEKLLAPEFERFPELNSDYRRKVVKLHGERTERRRREWELSDLVVANSEFTAASWKSAGWEERDVRVIPYGAPPVHQQDRDHSGDGPLRCIWAGTFSVRKGAHYLIEALQLLGSDAAHVVVEVYGAVTMPPASMEGLPSSLQFKGSVPRSELFDAMRSADLLVFPTLCDGFGLVVNEALAQGLPVLTTPNAGAADLVVEGKNGWLIRPGDAIAISDALRRALDQRRNLPEMSEEAKRTAAAWQWSDYRREIARNVCVSANVS